MLPEWLKNALAFDESKLEEEERTFVRQWIEGINEKMTRFAMIMGSTYLVILMPFMGYTVPKELLLFSYCAHSLLLIIILSLGAYARVTGSSLIKWGMFIELSVALMITYFGTEVLAIETDPDSRWMGLVAMVGVSGWLMLGFPSQYRAWKYASAWYITVPLAGLMTTDLSIQALSVVASILACFLAAKVAVTVLLKREGLRTYHFQKLAAAGERQKIEHELALAKRIQNSMQPEQVRALDNGSKLMVYKKTHNEVGGDWAAVRTLANGDTIVVVADAVGKGIQAALVIHAIQSLWAYRLADSDFDPEDWIHCVNSALVSLGKTESHAATMGILRLSANEITYWSAAHPPLFFLRADEVRPIFSRGTMLGISHEMILTPVAHPFDPTQDSLVFGSDGVLDKGSRHTNAEILALCESVRTLGVKSLDGCLTDDDKTCVLIEPGKGLRLVA
jgi:hypothetical protein